MRVLDELLLRRAALDRLGPVEQVEAQLGEVAPDVLGDAEVDEREPLGSAALDLVERLLPRLDVDLGRRRRRHDEAAGQDAHAARVAGVERPVGVEVADVVGGVARRREAVEAEHAVPDGVDVLLPAPARARPRASRTCRRRAGARSSPAGTGRRGAVRRSPRRAPAAPGARGRAVPAAPAWSRWMWLSSRCRTSVEREAAVGEARLQRVDRRRGAAVEERRPVVGVEQVARDDPLAAEVVEVDRLRGHPRGS